MPYLRSKAHEYYEELGGGIDPDLIEAEAQRLSSHDASQQVSIHLIGQTIIIDTFSHV